MTRVERVGVIIVALVLIVGAGISIWSQVRRRLGTGMKPTDTGCLSNFKQLAIGITLYREENNDILPPAKWTTAIMPLIQNHDMLDCPLYSLHRGGAYAMNAALVGKPGWSVADESKVVLLLEFDGPGPNTNANVADRAKNRHDGSSTIAYANARVKFLKADVEP
jgi:hypothetical protein